MMEGFRKNYAVYYSVLFITGLWPFDQSLRSKILRTVFSVVILYCIGIQISTLRLVDMSVYNIVMVLSYGCPMLLYFLRYMGFVVNFPIIKCVFENIENDLATLKNPTEIELFSRQTLDARRVISVLIALMCAGITMIVVTLLIPTILESKLQIYFLNFFGFMYKERSQETNYVCVQIVFVSTIGLLSLACTEASLAVFSCYLCGLFEIASYRIRIAVNEMAKSASVTQSTNLIDIRSAVETHQRAIDLSASLTNNMMLSYLVAIVTVVISFAANLYRLFLAITELHEIENTIISAKFVLVHVIIMFLNNYSGQKLISTSTKLFHDTYDLYWYCIPPKSQKMLLFVLMRSANGAQFNLAGLFIPCYQGFTTMISSSFSYFTVLMSI
ncbi:putative odorant receptor 92a isoform X2 [Megalopta genalis]|uniref:putative odorant receptor 92a isoform X2 n=1 Tax=Megalopta genalis TaxID=115081 RepID=UPI003FD00B4D